MTVPVVTPEDEPLTGAFNPDDYDWPRHLKIALNDLRVKALRIDRDWRYYNGDHPTVWLTEGIQKKLDDQLITNMAENWCDEAVDAPVKRLFNEGFVQANNNSLEVAAAQAVWTDNDLEQAQKDLYTQARCTGEAFLFAWKDDTKDTGVDATIVDARNVCWPDDCHRNDPSRVIKVWADEDEGVWRATCYYKYVVVRLIGPSTKSGGLVLPQGSRYFQPDPDDPGGLHGFEQVPVIRFALHKKRQSLIHRISTIQDKINKLSANLLVSAEFNAWRKTIIMTEQRFEDGELVFRPNRINVIDPGGGTEAAPTAIWESTPTELSIYTDAINSYIDKLFTKADLPGHMKVQSDRVAPSGAAYEADEGPFTEAIEDMQKAYGASWQDFYMLTLGVDVKCQWRNPHVKSDYDEAQTVKTYVDASMPIKLALKYYAGWTDPQLEEFDNAPLSPKEQLSIAASKALMEGGANDQTAIAQPPTPPNSFGSGQRTSGGN